MTLPTNPEGAKLVEEAREEAKGAREWRKLTPDLGYRHYDALMIALERAAKTIDRLADALTAPPPVGGASVEDVIAALEPFAEAANEIEDSARWGMNMWEHPASLSVTVADFRRAAKLLALIRSERG